MALLAGYVRVSSLCQKDNTSFQTQCDVIEAYAKVHGHQLLYVAFDVESGGSISNRKGLEFVLNETKTGNVEGIICAKLDRFARSVQDGLSMAKDLRSWHKQLVIIDLNLDTSEPMGEFTYTVLLAVAELERKLIQKRTLDGKNKVEELGGWGAGNPGFGYKMLEHGEKNCKIRVADPEQQRWIKTMLISHNEHGWSYKRIAAELNRLAIPSKRGAKWIGETVRGIVLRHANYY